MSKENEKQNLEIAIIKEKVGKIEEKVNYYDQNHFPSIEKRFDRIEKKLAYYSGAIVVASAIIQFLADRYAK